MTRVAFPQSFLIRLLRDLIDKQTWTDEGSVSERMLRSQLLLLACVRKYQPCVQRAEGYFREWKEANGNLRSVLTNNQLVHISAKCWEKKQVKTNLLCHPCFGK